MPYCIVTNPARCISCYACMAHCHVKNKLPSGVFLGKLIAGIPQMKGGKCIIISEYQTCYSCSDPWCIKICKVNALQRDDDGTVWIDSQCCVGCGLCSRACPWHIPQIIARETDDPTLSKRVAVKCDHCRDWRTDREHKNGIPACVAACTAHALCYVALEDAPEKFQKDYETKMEAARPHADAFIAKVLAKQK